MPRRFMSSLSFLSTTFCARMSPNAFSSAAVQAFVNTCRASRGSKERYTTTHSGHVQSQAACCR